MAGSRQGMPVGIARQGSRDLKERPVTRLTARPALLIVTFLPILYATPMSADGFNGIAVTGWVAGWRNWTAFKLDGGAPSGVTREPSVLGVAGGLSPAVLGNVRHFSNGPTIRLFDILNQHVTRLLLQTPLYNLSYNPRELYTNRIDLQFVLKALRETQQYAESLR